VSVPTAGDAGGVFDRLKASELGGDIKRISRWLVSELRDAMPEQPSKTGLEFSIKIAGKFGRVLGVLAEVGAEAAVVVKLEWTNPRPSGAEGHRDHLPHTHRGDRRMRGAGQA
jgi:hypothetical protein